MKISKNYDVGIIGCGFYGAVFANQLIKAGKKVAIFEKRSHIGGKYFTMDYKDTIIHKYGPHLFHTNNEEVYNLIKQYSDFQNINFEVVVRNKNVRFTYPLNLTTLQVIYGFKSDEELIQEFNLDLLTSKQEKIENREQQVLSMVGSNIYNKIYKNLERKIFGKSLDKLPVMDSLKYSLDCSHDNRLYKDKYQGLPKEGYTKVIEKLIAGADLFLDTEYYEFKRKIKKHCKTLVFTGALDDFYDFKFGKLKYRGLSIVHEEYKLESYQDYAIELNTSSKDKFFRVAEYKKLCNSTSKVTVISKEIIQRYSQAHNEIYEPVYTKSNLERFNQYLELTKKETNVIFGGSLPVFKNLELDETIAMALEDSKKYLENVQ